MKIFGIGLSKTGTTSLARALQMLGYSVKDNLGVVHYTRGDLSAIDSSTLDANDAFTDTPIPSFYRELDERYPNSKFILTVRDMDGWLASCKKQFNKKQATKQSEAHNQLFMDLFGCIVFDERKFKSGYEGFVAGALEYFRERPQDLLVFNVTAEEGWEKLCPFLGRPIPECLFPKANVTQIRWMNIKEIVAIAREAGMPLYRTHQLVHREETILSLRHKSVPEMLRTLLSRTRYAMRRGDMGGLQAARKRANNTIFKRLTALNPNIPVVSAESGPAPARERNRWNHFWLVDPLDSSEGFLNGTGEFTVNIALIEDTKPIVGVVHAPATDTTFYAMAGKEAFKVKGDGQPHIVAPQKTQEEPVQSQACLEKREATQFSIGLDMCLSAEGEPAFDRLLRGTMEWQTAAGHIILNCAGMTVKVHSSKSELLYNKEHLANGPIFIA